MYIATGQGVCHGSAHNLPASCHLSIVSLYSDISNRGFLPNLPAVLDRSNAPKAEHGTSLTHLPFGLQSLIFFRVGRQIAVQMISNLQTQCDHVLFLYSSL